MPRRQRFLGAAFFILSPLLFLAIIVAAFHVVAGWVVQANNKEPVASMRAKYALHRAASTGDLARIRAALDRGADINLTEPFEGFTPLYLAVKHDQTDAVELLLTRGAYPSPRDPSGNTPLHRAAELTNTRMVRLLLDHGANLHAVNNDRVPVHERATFGEIRNLLKGAAATRPATLPAFPAKTMSAK